MQGLYSSSYFMWTLPLAPLNEWNLHYIVYSINFAQYIKLSTYGTFQTKLKI